MSRSYWTTCGKPVNKTERASRPGSAPYLGANGQTGWIDKAIFDEELVLVVEDETFVGRTAPFSYYFAGKCWVNNHTRVLQAKRDVVLPRYLNLALSYSPVHSADHRLNRAAQADQSRVDGSTDHRALA